MALSVKDATTTHNVMPNTKGRSPTALRVARLSDVPMKNRLITKERRAKNSTLGIKSLSQGR